jgi:hypothetical protein
MAEHDGDVYCKQCYARKYGIRGVGFGMGAGALGMDTGERYGNTESLPYVRYIFFCNRKSFFFRNKTNYPPVPGITPPY